MASYDQLPSQLDIVVSNDQVGHLVMTFFYTLCEYETWYHAREIFTVLALVYLMRHAHC